MKLSPIGIGLMLLAASSSAWGVRPKTSQMVPLRDVVVVDHAIILLSDLLPANAPLGLKSAGDAIPLGRAPQIGSIRTFEPEQITHQLAIAPTLLAVLRIPFRITIRRFQWPIKNTAVRKAISVFLARQKSKFGDLMSSATFQLDSTGALQQDPSLSVTGMDWDDRRGVIQFRLRCANRAVCGSFLAYAVSPLSITADGWAKFGSQLFPNDRAMARKRIRGWSSAGGEGQARHPDPGRHGPADFDPGGLSGTRRTQSADPGPGRQESSRV